MRNWIIVFFVIFAARLSAHDGDSIKITHGPYLCDMGFLSINGALLKIKIKGKKNNILL